MIGSKSHRPGRTPPRHRQPLRPSPPTRLKIVAVRRRPPLIEALNVLLSPPQRPETTRPGPLQPGSGRREQARHRGSRGDSRRWLACSRPGTPKPGWPCTTLPGPEQPRQDREMPGRSGPYSARAAARGGGDGGRIGLMILAQPGEERRGRVAADGRGRGEVDGGDGGGGGVRRERKSTALATMYEMSKGSLRFRALAKAAGPRDALMGCSCEGEGGDEVAKEMARRTLKVVRGDEEEEEEEEAGVCRSVVSDGLVSFRREGGETASVAVRRATLPASEPQCELGSCKSLVCLDCDRHAVLSFLSSDLCLIFI
ncbi:uncharacterized protein A4U43_C03F31970 [Asparagus officinalis]|uniref:Uncharacterized protein n=1 Tax=Asparagus officinalis TaxID=4686 RepID=A0A5P1FF88_ASPOF|nr:uncharacterized protein A4U43_C03F31970 [Asparagus officinalis]